MRARVVGVWPSISISVRVARVAFPITVAVALMRVGLLQAVVRPVWYAIVVPVATFSAASDRTLRSERRIVLVVLLQAVVPAVLFPVVMPAVLFPVVIPVVLFPMVVPVVLFPVVIPAVLFSVVIPVVLFPVALVAISHEVTYQARYQCCLVLVVLLQAVVQDVSCRVVVPVAS
jgi:hypothetical protein